MKSYDSDFLKLPHIPFIIELPDMCFKVHIPLCTAAQKAYLPFFDLIPKVGYKTLGFLAYSSMFTVIGKDGWGIDFNPHDWSIERESGIDDKTLSLNNNPASGFEAWVIYACFQDRSRQEKIDQIVSDLETNQRKPQFIMNIIPDIGEYIAHSKVIERAVGRHVLRDKPVKKKSRKREILGSVDLVESYMFLLAQQPKPKPNKEPNKAAAMREAVRLLYPDATDDEAAKKEGVLKEILKRLSKSRE
jgi:hypothetical protein